MYTNSHSQKRFPTACRFFAQGICRAGQSCSFAHILPLEGEPDNSAHAVLFGDAIDDSPGAFSPQHIAGSTTDSHSLQKAIRDLELDQLQKIYDVHYLRTRYRTPIFLLDVARLTLPLKRERFLHSCGNLFAFSILCRRFIRITFASCYSP